MKTIDTRCSVATCSPLSLSECTYWLYAGAEMKCFNMLNTWGCGRGGESRGGDLGKTPPLFMSPLSLSLSFSLFLFLSLSLSLSCFSSLPSIYLSHYLSHPSSLTHWSLPTSLCLSLSLSLSLSVFLSVSPSLFP